MRYRSKPTECEAMQWYKQNIEQYDPKARAQEIVAWVNANGGEARYAPAGGPSGPGEGSYYGHPARIAVRTINGWAYAAPGHYIVMGSAVFTTPVEYIGMLSGTPCSHTLLDFYPCDPATFESRWEPSSAN